MNDGGGPIPIGADHAGLHRLRVRDLVCFVVFLYLPICALLYYAASQGATLAVVPLVVGLFFLSVGAWALKRLEQAGLPWSVLSPPGPSHWRTVFGLTLLLMLGGGGLMVVKWWLVAGTIGVERATMLLRRDVLYGYRPGEAGFIAMVFIGVFVGPFAEEVVYRGYLLRRWSGKWGVRSGVVLTSVVFGLTHGVDSIEVTLIGLVLAELAIRTGSLRWPLMLHMVYNASAFGMSVAWPWLTAQAGDAGWVIGLGLALLGIFVGIPMLVVTIHRWFPPRPAAG